VLGRTTVEVEGIQEYHRSDYLAALPDAEAGARADRHDVQFRRARGAYGDRSRKRLLIHRRVPACRRGGAR
jgi:hypothetical protein